MNFSFAYGLGVVLASTFGIIAIITELEWFSLCGLLGIGTAFIIMGVLEDRKNDSSSEVKDDKYLKALNSENQNKNPAYFCDCGKYLGHRGFCSEECHNKHYDGKSESSEEWVLNYCPNCKQMTNHLQDGNCLKCGVNCSVLSELNEGGEK